MKLCSLHILFLSLLLYGSLASAQDAGQAGNKKPRTPADYQPRTLKEIAAMKPDAKDLRDKQGRLVVTANDLPSKVRVAYTGSTRLIPQFKKEAIRQWARLYAGSMEHYTEPYQREMLFIESGVSYWLAVQKNSRLSKAQLKKGQALNLYLIRVGAAIVGDNYDWTLLVEDFREAETSQPAAQITFREMRLRKPPLAELYFDIVLRNDRAQRRWFLLPGNLGPGTSALLTKGGVDSIEVFGPRGSGRVVLGHFLGTGGFYALLLPAHAIVRLRMFPINYWGDVPDLLQIEIVTARNLTIGGEPAASWFGLNPISSARADIAESALSQNRMIRSRHTPDRKEVTTLAEEESRFTIEVPLR
ncbi:MAG: hypothetical protein ACMG6H_08705 [Acidobacteriota bacterium]